MSMNSTAEQAQDRLITVVDDFGKNRHFAVVDQFEYAGQPFVIAKPVNDDSQDGKKIILRVHHSGQETAYQTIADDREWQQVFEHACQASIIWDKEVVRGYHGLGVKLSLWRRYVQTAEKRGYWIAVIILICGRFIMRSKPVDPTLEFLYMPFLLFAMLTMGIWMKKRYFSRKRGRK